MASNPIHPSRLLAQAVLAALCLTPLAHAYVDLAPTLGKIAADSKSIALVEVTAFDSATQTVTLKPVRTLKGETMSEPIVNRVAPPDGLATPPVRRWAEPGSIGVWFATKTTALVCIGPAWYQVKRAGDAGWKLGVDRPDLALAYCGAPARLADAVTKMLAGGTATLTAVVYGATDVDTSFDLALGRTNLPGLVRVQRVKGSLSMPPMVAAASGQGDYVIGPGPVDAADLSRLRDELKSTDAAARAEAAESIGQLGEAGRDALAALRAALGDPAVGVRTAAAAAVLKISPGDADARPALERELLSTAAIARRDAASAVAMAGGGAAPLMPGLVPLLIDPDDAVRSAALAAVTTVGPTEPSTDAAIVRMLVPMLNDTRWRVEAADALGRLGAAARPVPASLVAMLADPQVPVQWAAVRAMAQIGGPEAKPAVELIKQKLPGASEVEQYNMMIYLALLGPVASDAAPVVRSSRIKNPVLPGATLWAIGDTTKMPWTIADGRFGGMFGPGGPGGGPDGGGGPADIKRYMYAAYIRELGDRLKPAADALARQLLDGTAGDVPEWGYGLLSADVGGSLATLTPALASADRTIRQRAAVALGFMGRAAAPALPQVQAAAAKATDPREQRMMAWCVKKLTN